MGENINSMPERCECCGVAVKGGKKGCKELFDRMLAREYSDPNYGKVHLLTVDSYILQHSESHGPRSNAFHLLRLGWLLLGNGNPHIMQKEKGPIPFLLKDYQDFPFLEPPDARGEATVLDALAARNPKDYAEVATRWGWSVWMAFSRHHDWAIGKLKGAGVDIS